MGEMGESNVSELPFDLSIRKNVSNGLFYTFMMGETHESEFVFDFIENRKLCHIYYPILLE